MNFTKALALIQDVNLTKSSVFKGFGVSGQGILGDAMAETVYLIHADFKLGIIKIEQAQIGTAPTVSRIGRELLNYGTLTIDYINSQYYFEKYPKRLNKPRPNFGFDIITEKNKVTVGVVWENTRAQKMGLTSGLEILSINDKSFENKTSCEIEKILLVEFSKKKLEITYLKNGITLKGTLTNIKI